MSTARKISTRSLGGDSTPISASGVGGFWPRIAAPIENGRRGENTPAQSHSWGHARYSGLSALCKAVEIIVWRGETIGLVACSLRAKVEWGDPRTRDSLFLGQLHRRQGFSKRSEGIG